tara:strand:- start:77 stop:1078 length:1002 start_codon:yes stop_codon:yes gene_type:complete
LVEDSRTLLQHPRRNLGNRYRSQAEKFVNLATNDNSRFAENIAWAEQSARQAILYDYTEEQNWRCLANIKAIVSDSEGLVAVMEDLFSILGRDPDQIDQLKQVDFQQFGLELLEAVFARDPLNPDIWWQQVMSGSAGFETLDEFVDRCQRLDFRDARANVIFGRRIERIRDSGRVELFTELARNLLAHRPQNHELWFELGRLYERLNRSDEAWICYDHVQSLRPHSSVREEFMARLTSRMDGDGVKVWSRPPVAKRQEFLAQMVDLASRVSTPKTMDKKAVEGTTESNVAQEKLQLLLAQGDYSEAFFVARRLVAEGEDWAIEYMDKARNGLD